jgi:hypothetical protein
VGCDGKEDFNDSLESLDEEATALEIVLEEQRLRAFDATGKYIMFMTCSRFTRVRKSVTEAAMSGQLAILSTASSVSKPLLCFHV